MMFSNSKKQPENEVDVVRASDMNKQGALLLDVREHNEYAEIHAPDTILIPLGQLKTRLPEISAYKDTPIVVICRSGVRSATATKLLQEAGYSLVSNIKGGILAWERAGLMVVRKS